MIVLTALTVEHKERPLGIDVAPRFGWTVKAPDLRNVVVAQHRVRVVGPDRVGWDSGWRSGHGTGTEYDGPALQPLTPYDWTVDVRTSHGEATAASAFTTGVLDGNWHGARWIGHPSPDGAAPLLRAAFALGAAPTSALLVAAAGGYARPRLNGVAVDGTELEPGFTDYDVRLQYTVTEVAPLLVDGSNELEFELGRGFYGKRDRDTWNWHQAPWHAEPCVRAFLVADGEVVASTGAEWSAIDGPTRYDDVYGGETYDARLERSSADDWARATVVPGPRGRLEHQRQQSIGPVERFAPVTVSELEPGRWVVGFPRVIAGWVELEVDDPDGSTVEVRYGEVLREDGAPNADDPHEYYDGRFQTDVVVLPPSETGTFRWHPRFSYKGFRYVEVRASRLPRLTAVLVHSLVARTGSFACSDAALTRLHELTIATVLNNLHGLPTDTPMYEKNGWTGDGMVGAELMLRSLDIHELLAKWSTDIADSRRGEGAPEVIAPHGGWTMDWSPAPTWHSALVLIPEWIHLATGDLRVLRDTRADAEGYLRFELSRCSSGIADTTLGDWVSPETDAGGGNAPEDRRVSATAFLVAMLDSLARTASVLGEDAAEWSAAAASVRSAFVREFFDAEAGIVRGEGDEGYRQAHNVLALAFDLLPIEHRQRVADSIAIDVASRDDHLSTGALATKFLLPVLTRHGHADAAWRVATQRTFPSWGFWLDQGATSLWEHWKPESRSRGHYFLGTIDDWLFGDVAGLSILKPGWRRARFAPALTGHLDWAEARVTTPQGELAARWWRADGIVRAEVVVPVGVAVEVELPGHAQVLGPGRHELASPAG